MSQRERGSRFLSRAFRLLAVFALGALPLVPLPPAAAIVSPGIMQQTGRVFAAGGATYDDFGIAVAIDGDTAVVGAPEVDGEGAAYVFVRSGPGWTLLQELPADPAPGDEFGYSVAIDGSYISVGAPGDSTGSGTHSGSVIVYEWNGSTWGFVAGLWPDPGSDYARLGHSVALSGEAFVAGAPLDDEQAEDAGAMYVFPVDPAPPAKLMDTSGEFDDRLGTAVAISGTHAVAGAPSDDFGAADDAGSVSFFRYDSGSWFEGPKMLSPDPEADTEFGRSVAMSGDTALVGAPFADTETTVDSGRVYVYGRSGNLWPWTQTLALPDPANYDNFGESIAVDGDMAIVGAYWDDTFTGSALVYTRTGGDWAQRQKLGPTGADGGAWGTAVALSNGTAVVGAPLGDGAATDTGVAYFFAHREPVYRFYRPKSGTHFYTPSVVEADYVLSTWPTIYTYEGVAYATNPENNSQPLYRFYNKKNGSHFYTASTAERDSVIANLSAIYSYDGPTYKVSTIAAANKPPVYRFYNKRNGSHFYTASESEKASVVANLSGTYTYEGTAFWLGQ